MNVATGDYVAIFFDADNQLIEDYPVCEQSLMDAKSTVQEMAPKINAKTWLIMRCVAQSTDKGPW
jgi:hypothetical protein